jgi:hypothetical protein
MSAPRTPARSIQPVVHPRPLSALPSYTGDLAFLQQHWPTIDKALCWLDYQDMNECGLLEVPEAGDWMDLLAVRYNVLYDNVLYYAAKLAHQEMAAQMPAGTEVYRPMSTPRASTSASTC